MNWINTPYISNPLDRRCWRPRWVKTIPRSFPLGNDCSPLSADIVVISPLLENWSGGDPHSPLTFPEQPRWCPAD